MSFNSSKWVSMGAVLQCPHLKGLWLSPMVQGSQAEGRLLGEELFGSHANEVTQAAAVIQPPKQQGQEASYFSTSTV